MEKKYKLGYTNISWSIYFQRLTPFVNVITCDIPYMAVHC